MTATGEKVLVLCLLALAVGPAAAEEIDKRFHESFDVTQGARLVLDHGDGDVTIVPWEKESIDVEVRFRGHSKTVGWSVEKDFNVEFRQTGNTVRVTGREPSVAGIGFVSLVQREYTYTIQAPDWVELELKGDDGDVEIEAWSGEIRLNLDDGDVVLSDIRSASTYLRLEDGDVEIRGIRGKLEVNSEDGDVHLRDCDLSSARIDLEDGDLKAFDCRGDFHVSADDGDLMMARLRGERLEFKTSDGDIDIDLVGSANLDLLIRTDDGHVNLGVAPSISAEFSIDSDDGSIRVDVPAVVDLRKDKHRVSGVLGDGEGRIRISVNDGRVVLSEALSDS